MLPAVEADAVPPSRHPSRDGLLLGSLSLTFACVALDNAKLALTVPTLALELGGAHAAHGALGWIVEANLIVYASLLLLGGACCERLGARRALLLGLAVFALASAAAAAAPSTWALCLARAGVGLGTALMTPASLAALQQGFEGARRARAIAIWTASFAGAAALGPVLGALLLERWGWRGVQLANVPFALLGVLGVASQLSRTGACRQAPLDGLGAALGLGGTAGTMLAATRASAGWAAACAPLAGGALCYSLLWAWQRRAARPMLQRELFAASTFRVALSISALGYFAYAGLAFAVAVALQVERGWSPRLASLAILPLPLGLLAGTLLAPRLLARLGAPRTLTGGLTLALAGAVAVALGSAAGEAWLCLGLAPFALGAGVSFPTVTELVLSAAPPERAGSAAASSETAFELGGALGVALLGTAGMLGVTHGGAGAAPALGAALASAGVAPSALGGTARAALGAALALVLALAASTRLGRAGRH